jgi:hypothetical protein
MRRTRLIPFVMCVVLAAPLEAQWQLTADAGVARLHQSGLSEGNALTFGAAGDALGDRAAMQSSFLAARSTEDRWTVQGLAIGLLHGPRRGAGSLDFTALLSSFSATSEDPTVSAEVMAQARRGGSDAGGSLGVGGGVVSHAGGSAPLFHAQANAWMSAGSDQLLGTVSLVRTKLIGAVPVPTGGTFFAPLSYADFSADLTRELGGVSLAVVAGARAGIDGVARLDGWTTGELTAWIAPHSAVVVGAGRTLEDAVRGVPSTTFFSLAVRIAARPERTLNDRRRSVTGVVVSVRAMADGRHRIEVRGATGARVEVMGDFTNWNPILLDHDGDAWHTDRALSPGLHRIALRVDDGAWIAPANLPHVTDDLGGVVGLITIP